jgi:succinoglycan biosynthesis transport protein ExoP
MTTNPIPSSPIMPGNSQPSTDPMSVGRSSSTRLRTVDPVRVLRIYARLLIFALIVGVLLGVGLWAGLRWQQPGYTSMARIEVTPPPAAAFGPVSDAFNIDNNINRVMQNEMLRIRSDNVLRDAINRELVQGTQFYQQFVVASAQANGTPAVDINEAIHALQEKVLSANVLRGSSIFQVSATTANRSDAERILRAVTEAYVQIVQRDNTARDTLLRDVLRRERDNLRQQVRDQSDSLARYAREHDLPGMTERRNTIVIRFQALAQQQVALQMALLQAEEAFASLRAKQEANQLEPTPEEVFQVENHAEVTQMTFRRNNLREQREAALALLGPTHKQVRGYEARIEAVENERQRIIDRKLREMQAYKLEQAEGRVIAIRSQLAALEGDLTQASSHMADLDRIMQEYKNNQSELERTNGRIATINRQLDDMRVIQARPDAVSVRIAEHPTMARLTFPRASSVIPTVAVLFVGMVTGLVFFKEMMDQRIKSPADFVGMPQLDVLGVLPDTVEDPSGHRQIEGVVQAHPAGLMAENFRQVRTAILKKMDRDGQKTIALTGAQAGCGVSSLVQNLAASISLNGRRVVIVDANFRRPSQHRLAGISNNAGLLEVIEGRASLDSVVVPVEGTNISVLPTGDAYEAAPELLESKSFRSTLEQLRANYDVVLLDTPPALITSDAQILAKSVDTFALVCRAESDERGMITRMIRQLDGQRASILGVVLNAVRTAQGGYFRRSYREFYSYRQTSQAASAAVKV